MKTLTWNEFLKLCRQAWKAKSNERTTEVVNIHSYLFGCKKNPEMTAIQVAAAAYKLYKADRETEMANITGYATSNNKTYLYIIDLDERGGFLAHVENERTQACVYEIRDGDELAENEMSIFEDGFMRHKNDIEGLESYLKSLFIIEPSARIIKG